MKVLYHHPPGSIALVMTDHDYRVLTGYREDVNSTAGDFCNQMLCQTDNPLEAWTSYYDAVDCEVRQAHRSVSRATQPEPLDGRIILKRRDRHEMESP